MNGPVEVFSGEPEHGKDCLFHLLICPKRVIDNWAHAGLTIRSVCLAHRKNGEANSLPTVLGSVPPYS